MPRPSSLYDEDFPPSSSTRLVRRSELDGELPQIVVVLDICGNRIADHFCAFDAVFLGPFVEELDVGLGRFLL